jgi:hypothetical protein
MASHRLGIELRLHLASPVWRAFFDGAFSFASILLIVFFGAALGNVMRGVPLAADHYFFVPQVEHAKRYTARTYGRIAQRYVSDFEATVNDTRLAPHHAVVWIPDAGTDAGDEGAVHLDDVDGEIPQMFQ